MLTLPVVVPNGQFSNLPSYSIDELVVSIGGNGSGILVDVSLKFLEQAARNKVKENAINAKMFFFIG